MKTGGIKNMSRSRQQGFSLLEVLVAMLILGIAVMGFAGLQVRALQSTGVAHVRSQAMTLATDLSERIRANRLALATYTTAANWTDPLPPDAPSSWSSTCLLTSTASNGCSDIQMAQFDIREVRYIAREVLPNGNVSVHTCDGGSGQLVACVFVAWNAENATATCTGNADDSGSCVMMKVVPW